MTARGKFITLEGGEGAGKSTSLEFLRAHIVAGGRDLLTTREPGGTTLGEALREMLLHRNDHAIGTDAELLMIFAARAQHLEEVIRPALAAGQWVLCDRFTDATYAYQGGGRGVTDARIAELERWVQGRLRPDLTILFDLPVDTGIERAGRRSAPDRFEREGRDFLQLVHDYYRAAAAREPNRFRIVDASQTPQAVQEQLAAIIDPLLEQDAP
jgi:dTMP kinase